MVGADQAGHHRRGAVLQVSAYGDRGVVRAYRRRTTRPRRRGVDVDEARHQGGSGQREIRRAGWLARPQLGDPVAVDEEPPRLEDLRRGDDPVSGYEHAGSLRVATVSGLRPGSGQPARFGVTVVTVTAQAGSAEQALRAAVESSCAIRVSQDAAAAFLSNELDHWLDPSVPPDELDGLVLARLVTHEVRWVGKHFLQLDRLERLGGHQGPVRRSRPLSRRVPRLHPRQARGSLLEPHLPVAAGARGPAGRDRPGALGRRRAARRRHRALRAVRGASPDGCVSGGSPRPPHPAHPAAARAPIHDGTPRRHVVRGTPVRHRARARVGPRRTSCCSCRPHRARTRSSGWSSHVQPVSTVHDEYFFMRVLQAHEMAFTGMARRMRDATVPSATSNSTWPSDSSRRWWRSWTATRRCSGWSRPCATRRSTPSVSSPTAPAPSSPSSTNGSRGCAACRRRNGWTRRPSRACRRSTRRSGKGRTR